MRDSIRLRRRLVLLACLPVLACSDPPAPERVTDEARRKTGEAPVRKAIAEAADDETSERKSTTELSREELRLQPIPGDPPWIDGYDPEEDPCISGNWCGEAEAAAKLSPNPGNVPEALGCVTRIAAVEPSPIPEHPKDYVGLSSHHAMQGSLNQHGTELARAKQGTPETTCCYHWFEYCSGRPLLEEGGRARVAEPREGDAWTPNPLPRVGKAVTGPLPQRGTAVRCPSCSDHELVAAVRERLAAAWLEDALAEHASIASFARTTLELMAHGAPPELLAAVQRAALDEIDHTRRCAALAQRYSGRAIDPGPLVPVSVRASSWSRLAVDTFLEGCVGETVAALVAERALGHARDAVVRETLAVIARDEANHAALAWRTLAWALERGGSEAREALLAAAEQAHHASISPSSAAPSEHDEALRAHGRLTADDRARALRDAWRDIIHPMLADLLTSPSAAAQRHA